MIVSRGIERHSIIPAAFVICEQDGKILLLRRQNTGYRDGYYGLPSGHVEPWEGPLAAAIREASEEAGLHILPGDTEIVHVVHRRAADRTHERVDFFFRAKKWEGEPTNMEPDKSDDIGWFGYDELPKMVPAVQEVLERIAKGEFYSEVLEEA